MQNRCPGPIRGSAAGQLPEDNRIETLWHACGNSPRSFLQALDR